MFNFDKPGRGVYKDAPEKRGVFLFLDIYGRKFWRVGTLSLFYTLFALPAFVIYFLLTTAWQNMFSPISDPAFITHMGIYLTLFFICFIGVGPASAGQAYVLRNFSRQEHAWVWEEFWTKTRENFRQAIVLFVLDILIIAILPSAAVLYLAHGNLLPLPPLVSQICGFFALVLLVIYIMMHFFLYPLMVTMDMKLGMLLKTAFQLTMAHLPGCVFTLLLSLATCGAFLALYYVNIGFILLFMALGFSTVTFSYVFYATRVMDNELAKHR